MPHLPPWKSADPKKTWLLTAFEKKSSALDKTTDTVGTLSGKRNGTATPQSTASAGKNKKTSDANQGEEKKSSGKSDEVLRGKDEQDKKKKEGGKIEDVGEHLVGARKDMLREIAKSLANITEAELVEKPFGKVYKKPDLKKAVESGALREKDAIFYEAYFFTMVNKKKPKVKQIEMRNKRYNPKYKTKAEKWAEITKQQLDNLRQFIELDEAGRDAVIDQALSDRYPLREQELAKIKSHEEKNPNRKYGDKTTPNPLWVTYEVMKRLGYSVGDNLDIPFSEVEANWYGTGYSVENMNGEIHLLFGSNMTLDEAIDAIVYMARLKRGDADIIHPARLFSVHSTKAEYGESGRYKVIWGGSNPKTKEFASKKEADDFANTKEGAFVYPVLEMKPGTGHKVYFVHPLTGEKVFVDDAEFDTKEEAEAYLADNFDEINDLVNDKLQEESEKRGEKKTLTADEVVHAAMVRFPSGKWVYAVVIDKKYANNNGEVSIIKEGFASRKDAVDYANSIKDEVLKTLLAHKEEGKKTVFFDTGKDSRIGPDYRNGKDVTAEDFMNTFGFRGVQFGNWTNQEDRQMALNQAYDALMDLANVIGVSPKAISLNGELGIAFGSRGSGNANAHYERNNVVINLTKTRGAGSLAHEWWHALDNYFARREGEPLGMVTDNREIAMRAELREAFNNMLDLVEKSDYARRSRAKGEYWGSMHEITARLLSEWIDNELKKRSELNTFLTRGANVERWQRYNYKAYEAIERIAGREPMPFEDFKERPESLRGVPYPTTKEVEQFGASLRHIFDTIEERVDEKTGMHALLSKVIGEAKPVSEEEAALRDAVEDLMREAGIEVIDDVEEGQRVLDMENDALLDKNKKRALETASPSLNGTDHHTVVSSADGAKVLKDLDTLVNEYEFNKGNKPKTFIGDLSRALGAQKHGSNSEYATFETKNGRVVTIRLANHNAKVSTFDNHNETDGISIVITANSNAKLTNDGNAHVTEFYYNAIKLRKVEGKPLADIVRSIKQTLYSGEFKDTTGLAERQEVNIPAKVRKMMVYHGSGADFDAFDNSHMGEGEGAQAHGWGTYVTKSEGTGRKYATKSNKATELKRSELNSNINRAEEQLPYLHGDVKAEKEKEIKAWKDELSKLDDSKLLYSVEIPDDTGNNYIEEFQTLQDLNRPDMARRIDKVMNDYFGADDFWRSWQMPGWAMREEFIRLSLGQHLEKSRSDAERKFSNLLSEAGVVGLHYNGRKDGDCYVIFNDKDLKIKDKVRFFHTSGGEAYGYTVGGKIYIDPRIATSETPIHEYAHLWAEALRKVNPKEWQNVVSLMKECEAVWEQVKREYPELTTDDEIADEVLAHYSGKRGAARLRTEMRKAMEGDKRMTEKAGIARTFDALRDSIKRFWKHIAEDLLHIHFTSADEVADKVMYDLLNKVKPGAHDQLAEERAEIERRAKEDGTWMKAPNGKESNLTEEQWVTVRTRQFKDWFGDWENDPEEASQAVDENGEPKVFYHNTDNDFTVFDADKNGTHTDAGWLGDGFYFYGDENEGNGYGHKKMGVFLNARNLYYASSEENEKLAEANNRDKSIAFRNEIEDEGYDAVYYNGDLRQEAVVFYPEQIKSATDNVGTFDAANPDIRYSKVEATDSVEAANKRFNEELERYEKGETPVGTRFDLGMPSKELESAGFPYLPISMRASLLSRKAGMERHPFEASDLRDLVKAMQKPIAIFKYSKENMRNLIVDVMHGGKHFLVGVTLDYKAGDIEVKGQRISTVGDAAMSEYSVTFAV